MAGRAACQIWFACGYGLLFMAGYTFSVHGILITGSQVGKLRFSRNWGHSLVARYTGYCSCGPVFALVASFTRGIASQYIDVSGVFKDRMGRIGIPMTFPASGPFILGQVQVVADLACSGQAASLLG